MSRIVLLAAIGAACLPLYGTIQIQTMTANVSSPQPLGTPVTWSVMATNSNPNPVAFQFNVAYGSGGTFNIVQDFRLGSQGTNGWFAQPFAWSSIKAEGNYQIQVIAKDFVSGESVSRVALFQLYSRVVGTTATVSATANPLVALFSGPPCGNGNSMRVTYQQSGGPVSTTAWQQCTPASTNFYIAGLYPSKTYTMNYQVQNSRGQMQSGPNLLSFTSGSLSGLTIPSLSVNLPPGPHTDTTDSVILHDFLQPNFPVATDMQGNVIWYYNSGVGASLSFITRHVTGGTMITFQNGIAWNNNTSFQQILRVIDLAGNTLAETNTGIVQQQLLALGATDMGPCNVKVKVGLGCMTGFYHDAILLPNGNIATIVVVEKIYPAGTQGDPSGLPVDIIGDGIVVMNSSLQPIWYWDSFQHAGGAPQLDINRSAVLNDLCFYHSVDCPDIQLMVQGSISPAAHDWLHSNSLYYSPVNGDFLLSVDHQDWVIKIDFNNGTGNGNVLWRMGRGGDFAFNNINGDPWPWFSHQHEAFMANNGNGPLVLLDDGTTRIAATGTGHSRGMALTVNEANMVVSPVLSADLGIASAGQGGAQSLANGNYSFQMQTGSEVAIELFPAAGTTNATQVYRMFSAPALSYRNWRMPSLYINPEQQSTVH